MAQTTTLEGLRSQIQTSVFGRRLGLDIGETLVGPNDIRKPVTAATSLTTGTNISAYGHTTITCASAATVFILADPVPGVFKTLTNISTGGPKVTLSNATIRNQLGSTNTFLLWTASSSGQTATLFGESTSVWQNMTSTGSTGITCA